MKSIKLILSFAICCIAFFGDYIVFKSKMAESFAFRAVGDSIVHGTIGFLSSLLFFSHDISVTSQARICNVVFCTILSSLIDIDHVFVAKSLHLKDYTQLKQRGIFHCTTFWIAITCVLLVYSKMARKLNVYISTWMLILAYTSHHIRDANRRGLWLYPYGHSAPIAKYLYVTLIVVLPLMFPHLFPYLKPPDNVSVVHYLKQSPCQHSPEALFHLAAAAVEDLAWPAALAWTEDDVASWISNELGLPEYRECFLDNYINGMRLIMFEDPSKLAEINTKSFTHMQLIASRVRRLFGTDFVRFARSVGLPPRKPTTHCTWFKSKSGPSWGIHKNWTRCDILRWMKIIKPESPHMDHWDLVWYQHPGYPKTKFARIARALTASIPHYKPEREVCREYLVPRKFRFQSGIPESQQLIWMERPVTPEREKPKQQKEIAKKRAKRRVLPKDTRLFPRKISLSGLKGEDLVLARRKMATPKFLA